MLGWLKRKLRRKRHSVQVTIRPLQGLGADRKAALKFLKRYFKKCGNYEATRQDILSCRTQGSMTIYGKILAGQARKIERLQNKLGIDVEVSYDNPSMNKRENNKVKYFEDKKQDWVVASY